MTEDELAMLRESAARTPRSDVAHLIRALDEARAQVESLGESNASLFKETERLKRRELRAYEERDVARAKLAALETQYHADSDRWISERDEARAIARRLRGEVQFLRDRVYPQLIGLSETDATCRDFDALPWAKDDTV
jgi:hypothetical protein